MHNIKATFSNLVPAMISNFPKYYNFTFVAPLNKRTALSTETKTLHIINKRYGCISEKLVSVWQQWILHCTM